MEKYHSRNGEGPIETHSALNAYELGKVDKIKRGLHSIDSKFGFTDDLKSLYNSIKRHPKATTETAIGATSVGGGIGITELSKNFVNTIVDLQGRNVRDTGYPIHPIQRITTIVNSSGNHTGIETNWGNYLGNFAIWGTAILLGLEGAYALHLRHKGSKES